MIVKPDVQAKLLKETVPGELVRFSLRRTMILGVVFDHQAQDTASGLAILLLENLPGEAIVAGQSIKVHDRLAEQMAASYGGDLEIFVDPSASVLLGSDPRFHERGLMVLTKNVRVIRTDIRISEWDQRDVMVDTTTWQSVFAPVFSSAEMRLAVTEWEIRLASPLVGIHAPKPVYKFKMKAENG